MSPGISKRGVRGRGRGALICLLLAACATPKIRVDVAREGAALRVRFRRSEPGPETDLPVLRATGGRLAQETISPDLGTACVLWLQPAGDLECRFPYGASARVSSSVAADPGRVEYVFLDDEGARVTASLSRACPVLPAVPLRVQLAERLLPARLEFAGKTLATLRRGEEVVEFRLPLAAGGELSGGDCELTLRTADGASRAFLLGVDADGVVTADSGFVRNWE